MTVKELKEELRILDPDPGASVAVDGNLNVELSIVYTPGTYYLNLGTRAEEISND